MKCRLFTNIPTCTAEEWRKKHEGHKITERHKTVDTPGYSIAFDKCEDCGSLYVHHINKPKKKRAAGGTVDVEALEDSA